MYMHMYIYIYSYVFYMSMYMYYIILYCIILYYIKRDKITINGEESLNKWEKQLERERVCVCDSACDSVCEIVWKRERESEWER